LLLIRFSMALWELALRLVLAHLIQRERAGDVQCKNQRPIRALRPQSPGGHRQRNKLALSGQLNPQALPPRDPTLERFPVGSGDGESRLNPVPSPFSRTKSTGLKYDKNMAFPRVSGMRGIEFGTPGASRKKLTDLVLHGNKRATAGLLREYEFEGEVIEHVGELLALIDECGNHVATSKLRALMCAHLMKCLMNLHLQRMREIYLRKIFEIAIWHIGIVLAKKLMAAP